MPSPFPRVDPFLEASGLWEGFHERLITYLSDYLSERVPKQYWVNIQERITSIGIPAGERDQFVGDVAVSSETEYPSAVGGEPEAVATLEPVTLTARYQEPARESYLEILHLPERELVTVIEVLSPSNKELPGREIYSAKRESLLNQFVHLVEIDLLVRGTRFPLDEPLPVGDYYAFVARAEDRPKCAVFPWGVRHPLPTVGIPLRAPDPDVKVDLDVLWKQAFDRGRYADVLDYSGGPPAFLRPADREWVKSLLAGEFAK